MSDLVTKIPVFNAPPCETNPDAFFPEHSDYDSYLEAKALCQTCPKKEACLQFALDNKIEYGCWGGTSPIERGHWEFGAPKKDEEFDVYINLSKYYTTRQVADMFGRQTAYIGSLIKSGKVPEPTVRINNRPFWKRDVIDVLFVEE